MDIDLSMIPDEKPEAKKGLDLSMIPSAGPARREVISTYAGPPQWQDMGLWDKLTVLSNPLTMGRGLREVFKESPDDMQAKSINAMAISRMLNIPAASVYENYDKIVKDPSITGMNFSGPGRDSSSPISRAYEMGEGLFKMAAPAMILAGPALLPEAAVLPSVVNYFGHAALGLGTFMGASEGLKWGGSLVTGKDYHFGMAASDLLPGDSSETVKSIFNMAEFFGSALAAGGVVKGWNKILPGIRSNMAEKLFRDVITEYKAPQNIYVSPEKVRDLQMGNEDIENQLVKGLDLDGAQWRQALRMGVDIEVPAEKLIKIVDKPWFAKIKEDLNKTGIFRLSPFEEVRLIKEGQTAGRARPSGLLPAPEAGAAGTETPGPLFQSTLQPATEALDRIKQEIQAAGYDQQYAETTAALLDARSRTWAIQTGRTPADYFDKWGPTFKSAQAPATAPQETVPGPLTTSVTPSGEPGTVSAPGELFQGQPYDKVMAMSSKKGPGEIPPKETLKPEGGKEYDAKKLNTRAIRKYGETNVPESIGYITRDGKGIDSSGKRLGASSEGRAIDHREIAQHALGNQSVEGFSENMRIFMNETGNIRIVNARDRELNIDVPLKQGMPTPDQLNKLERLASGKTVFWDLTDEKGNPVRSGEGKYYYFVKDLKETVQSEAELKRSLTSGKLPKQLQPLADFIKNNNLSKEQFLDSRFNRENPLYAEHRKQMDKTGVGVNKIWSDFGIISESDFYDRVIQDSLPNRSTPPGEGGEVFQGSTAPKGSFSLDAQHRAVISFFQSADLSTAPHEIFHLFLEDLHDTALTEGVPEQVKKDMQAVLDWLHVKSWEEIGTAQKERWARAGEKYLGQGKAPSEDLKGVFERFKEWILSVYRVLRDLNVNLTKTMKGVFDRLLATEEEIQNMKAEMDIQPLWKGPEAPPGVGAKEWSGYKDLAKRAAQATAEAIERRRMGEFEEARVQWAREAEELYLKDVRHVLMEQIVQGGGLNKGILLREFDPATVDALLNKRPGLVREDGSLSHEMVALGSNDISTEQLVDTLLTTETKEEFINDFVKTKSEEFDSEVPLGETAITDEYLNMLQAEMVILLREASKGKGTVPPNSQVKKRVRRETGQSRVENLVSETDALRAGLFKASQAARAAMKAGKIEEALKQKGRQREIVMNLRQRYQAQRNIEQARAYFTRAAKSPTIDWDFKAQILDLLADHGVITRQDFPREGMPGLRQFIEEIRASGEMIDISDNILDRQHIGPALGKTYDEMMDLENTVKQLEHLGRIRNKLIAEENARDIEEAVKEITDKIKESYGKKFVEPSGHLEFEEQKNIIQKAGQLTDSFIKELIKPEVIIRLLDGLQEMGPVWDNTFAKIKKGEDKEIVLGKDFMKRLGAIFDKIPKEQRRSWLNQKISTPEIPEKFLTKSQMIMIALNSGNIGNREALKGGSGPDPAQVWTDESIQAVTDRLSKEEWQLVQDVWTLINELYKPLDEVHRTMTGVPLKKVEGITVKTPYGDVEGQYFPLVFDPKQSKRAERFILEQAEKDLFTNYYAKPTPASGFTKERVGGKMFPLLDFSVITQHINDVVHFVSNALEIRDVNKVLSNGEVRSAIDQSLGENAYKQLGPWLRYVAQNQHKPVLTGEKVLGWIRRNSSIVILGVKASTALLQPLAATQGIEYLGLVPWLKGVKAFYSSPVEWSNFIKERSPMMSTRYSSETLDREMAQFAHQFNPTGDSIKNMVISSFFAWMNTMDATVTYPTWMAAYKVAMDKFLWHEQKAVEYADMVTRLSQASSAVKDQPLAMQGKEGAWKLFTMFQTFFNAFFNRMVERVDGFGLGKVGIGGLMAAFTWLVLVPSTFQYAAFERKIPTPKDIGREGLQYLASAIPLIRDFANIILTDFDYKASPAFGLFYETGYLSKSLKAKNIKLKSVLKHSLMLSGYFAGLPTAQAAITMSEIFDMIDGKDSNPLNLLLRKPQEKKK